MKYDPDDGPKPEEWLALSRDEGLRLIEEWHARAELRSPDLQRHAIGHALAENMIALNAPPFAQSFAHMLACGVRRHDAIHIIGAAVVRLWCDILFEGPRPPGDPARIFFDDVDRDLAIARATRPE